jgi:ribosome biogenesis GTPase
MTTGVVIRVEGGRYTISLDGGGSVEASLRGRLKREDRTGDRVVIGDRVRVGGGGDGGHRVEEVLPRRTELVRRGPGGRRAKLLAANLDGLIVVVSVVSPDVRPELTDRLLAVGESCGIPCSLVVNKLDLPGAGERAEDLAALYERIGYTVLRTSAATGIGLNRLALLVCSGTWALMGPSGVGKSSLLNALDPSLDLRVGEVSWKTRRGRHTTVTSRLIQLECGGRVADTPGIGDVGVWGVDPDGLDRLFPEFRAVMERCRFRGCSHVQEPDCAVRQALEAGEIDERRYGSYLTLRGEAS